MIEFTRGTVVESLHHGALAVCDAQGRLIAHYGDPQAVTYLRSSAKPFQALSLLESGAAARYGYTTREIALACASHQGADLHADAVVILQNKIGVAESDLLCGQHPVAGGHQPRPNRHNCSGKHTGMLAQAAHLDLPFADYVNPQHPLQQTILKNFAEMCDLETTEVVVGVDGCSAPNFAVPLAAAATAFARLADPTGLPAPRATALKTIFAAMNAYPEMVAGPGELDTEIMRLKPGLLISKGGAEGYHAFALAPGALGPASPALGLAMKAADGNSRATNALALETLRQLGALTESDLAALADFGFGARRPVKNWRGIEAGEMRPCFELVRSQ